MSTTRHSHEPPAPRDDLLEAATFARDFLATRPEGAMTEAVVKRLTAAIAKEGGEHAR